MEWLIFGGAVTGSVVLGVIAQRLGWIDLSDKRRSGRGSGPGFVSIGDEVFNPTRHEAQLELDRQTMLPAPAPVPSDGVAGIYDGRIRISV